MEGGEDRVEKRVGLRHTKDWSRISRCTSVASVVEGRSDESDTHLRQTEFCRRSHLRLSPSHPRHLPPPHETMPRAPTPRVFVDAGWLLTSLAQTDGPLGSRSLPCPLLEMSVWRWKNVQTMSSNRRDGFASVPPPRISYNLPRLPSNPIYALDVIYTSTAVSSSVMASLLVLPSRTDAFSQYKPSKNAHVDFITHGTLGKKLDGTGGSSSSMADKTGPRVIKITPPGEFSWHTDTDNQP